MDRNETNGPAAPEQGTGELYQQVARRLIRAIDGGPPAGPELPPASRETQGEVERLLDSVGANVERTEDYRAYYDLARDKIVMPAQEQFRDPDSYCRCALHSLGHWTGHADRLDRETLNKGVAKGFASADYAREELRSEIFAMAAAERLGVRTDPERHAAHVEQFAEQLPGDRNAEIDQAAREAGGMVEYAFNRALQRDKEQAAGIETPERLPDQPGMLSPADRVERVRSAPSR